MEFRPHDYQVRCIEEIYRTPAVGLFLDMGLGKTVITLTAIDNLIALGEVEKVLVIAPLRVAQSGWAQEVEKWEHLHGLRVSRVLGSQAERKAHLAADADIYVINRENVQWLVEYLWPRWPFDTVVIDELSSFKSPRSERFKALRKVRPKMKRVIGLTGTPTPNGLIDLWSQIYLLDMGERLGKSPTTYTDVFFRPGRRNGYTVYNWILKEGAADDIQRRISDICISMSAADYLKMPDRFDIIKKVQLPEEARQQYKEMEKKMILPLKEEGVEISAASAAAVINKLLQIANGNVYDDTGAWHELHDAKLDALEDLVESANGQSILVYYSFKSDVARMRDRFGDSFTVLQDEQDVADWNAGKIPMLVCHPDSAGHGLNLQAGGHIMVWYGLPWSLEKYQQANARLYRQGQTKPVSIYHLVAEGTADEMVMAALERKDIGQKQLLEALKADV